MYHLPLEPPKCITLSLCSYFIVLVSEIRRFFDDSGKAKVENLKWTTFNIYTTQLHNRKFAKITVAAKDPESLKKGESRLRITLRDVKSLKPLPPNHCTICFDVGHRRENCQSCAVCCSPLHLSSNCRFIADKLTPKEPKIRVTGEAVTNKKSRHRRRDEYAKTWWRETGKFNPEILKTLVPIGPADDLKQTVSVVTDGIDIKYGFPQMVFSSGFFVRAIGIQTLYFAEILSSDLRYTEASMSIHTSQLRSDTAVPFSEARSHLIEIMQSRRTIIWGDAQELTTRLHLEFTDLVQYDIELVNLQDLYGTAPLETLIRFFMPDTGGLQQTRADKPYDGKNYEKISRYLLKLYHKYHQLISLYGQIPSGPEARNLLVENKDINWWIQNRDCSEKRQGDVKQ